jgi:DNA polymerase-3 subunit delta'
MRCASKLQNTSISSFNQLIKSVFPWHDLIVRDLNTARAAGRFAHGILIEGPSGLGKLDLAFLIAADTLGAAPVLDGGRVQPPVHPDFRWVTLETDDKGRLRKQITVGQVREVCGDLALTSYAGGAKVAIIAPAERMNRNAANSLLKTLEEPSPGTLLILVRARTATLPVTVASRCQRVRVAAPDPASAVRWLRERGGDGNWERLLCLGGGSPLAAESLAAAGHGDLDTRFSRQLAELLERRADPVEVAAEWAGEDLETCLTWLSVWTDELARRRLTGSWTVPPVVPVPESVIDAIPAEWIYWYRDDLHGAMRRTDGALNVELTLENLLVPWAGGLEPQEARG